mmetsp:Transcript_163052/g.522865  ORF Transcript_163052/g.522865 Transcript_163052/m.522865 type:complete len:242 (+) Transcript_163052:400-1125(+)
MRPLVVPTETHPRRSASAPLPLPRAQLASRTIQPGFSAESTSDVACCSQLWANGAEKPLPSADGAAAAAGGGDSGQPVRRRPWSCSARASQRLALPPAAGEQRTATSSNASPCNAAQRCADEKEALKTGASSSSWAKNADPDAALFRLKRNLATRRPREPCPLPPCPLPLPPPPPPMSPNASPSSAWYIDRPSVTRKWTPSSSQAKPRGTMLSYGQAAWTRSRCESCTSSMPMPVGLGRPL